MTHTARFSPAHPDLRIDLELPSGPPPAGGWPIIVWLHGGGWRLQDRSARPSFSRHFCSDGFAMASIDYRLAPEHPHPAQVIDLRQALRWLRRHGSEFELDTNAMGLWGSSAGSHIAAFTALSADVERLPGEFVHPDFEPQSTGVSCVVDGYGPARIDTLLPEFSAPDASATTPEEDLLGGRPNTEAELASMLDRARRASPGLIDIVAPPPFFILHGTADTAVPPSQSQELHERLTASGGESLLYLIEGFGHGFFNPGEVLELGPGIRLDNGRLEAEPDTPFTADNRGGFDPAGRFASFDLVRDFFAHHLKP